MIMLNKILLDVEMDIFKQIQRGRYMMNRGVVEALETEDSTIVTLMATTLLGQELLRSGVFSTTTHSGVFSVRCLKGNTLGKACFSLARLYI